MKKILILAGRYLPGYKDGGPVRTLINLTDLLGDEYDFRLAVLDRDHGDTQPYPNIKVNEWNQVGKAKVWYYRPGELRFSLIRKLAREADLIYLCGFYDRYGYETLILNRMGMLFGKPVVVASMGSFSEGALSQKSLKKKVFISCCKALGLFDGITWSVTSSYELEDVKREVSSKARCMIAEDLPRSEISMAQNVRSGALKVVFLSRICRQKNLLYCAEILQEVSSNIEFDIYGPMEDQEYWELCESVLKTLPDNVRWHYCGEVDTNSVPEVFSKYDVFLFPTMGENYGHVIFEALASGCVPIVSDRTPWNWLQEYGSGYILPLDNEQVFAKTIDAFAAMTVDEKRSASMKAIESANMKIQETREHTGYREIFEWRGQ